MFTVENSLYVDISNLKHARAKIKQYDNGIRYITIYINDNGKPLNIEDNSVKIYLGKTDGTFVLNDVEYIDIHNGIVRISITSQMSAIAGIMPCELVIWDNKTNSMTTSYKFELEVEKTYYNQSKVTSANEFGVLGDVCRLHEEEILSADWILREDGLYEKIVNHNKNSICCSATGVGLDDGEQRFLVCEVVDLLNCKIITDEIEDIKVYISYKFC